MLATLTLFLLDIIGDPNLTPEPVGLALLAMGAVLLLRRRTRP